MATDLNDPDETRSFLVPAYEFEKGSEACDFDPQPQTCLGPVSGPDDMYRLIHRDELFLQPNASSKFLLSASALYNPSLGQSDQPHFLRLQASPSEKPARVRSRCLMVEGRRLAPRREDGVTELVPAYAAWQIPKGDAPREEPWLSRIAYDRMEGGALRIATKSISAFWSGQGALCVIAPDRTRQLLLIEFRIFDDDPEKPDLLKVWVARHALSPKDTPEFDPTGLPISTEWKKLIARAERGYLDECGEASSAKAP